MANDLNRIIDKFLNPDELLNDINFSNSSLEAIVNQYRKMYLIRRAEEIISDNIENGTVNCPCHLAIGQEAIAVGVSEYLRKSDRVFGNHRSHAHFLAMNNDTRLLFSEVLGKESGCSRGMGGSMHLIDRRNGFWGAVPIVGATVPIAVGAGLAAKMDKNQSIAVTYFGDGAIEEGAVQESLNFASSQGLPVLFVCENNLFSSHLHISLRQPLVSTARFATANGIPFEIVDGNNITEINNSADQAINFVRTNQTPFFLEVFTYRLKGHVGHREDIDVGVQRSEDLLKWKLRDPVVRLRNSLLSTGANMQSLIIDIEDQVNKKVDEDWNYSRSSSYPPESNIQNFVYAP